MSKFNITFDSSDFIDVVEESNDNIIIQDLEGSVNLDRKAAELIYKKLDEMLHDETAEQLESKLMDALNELDKVKDILFDYDLLDVYKAS